MILWVLMITLNQGIGKKALKSAVSLAMIQIKKNSLGVVHNALVKIEIMGGRAFAKCRPNSAGAH
jgi:hypothetical protein